MEIASDYPHTPRWCFVVPRYGKQIAGGAETLVRTLAERLVARGDSVTVYATCARDNRSWENSFPSGKSEEDGVTVLRFPVDARDLEIWIPRQIALHDGLSLSLAQQFEWMEQGVNSAALYQAIAQTSQSFHAMIFAPYLFGTTFWGSLIAPQHALLIPCLHDEAYAYTDVIRAMFQQVRGCLFNAEGEQLLAQQLYGSLAGGVVGMGFDAPPEPMHEFAPPCSGEYLVYLGRKETGKNVHHLIDYFIASKERGALSDSVSLVIVGGGDFSDIERPEALQRDDIIDLPAVSEEEKRAVLRQALALVQPSVNESFSIVLMEAWQQKTPVLVHARCAVTRQHCISSGGGVFFANEQEFAAEVNLLQRDPKLRACLGSQGCHYVASEYSWDAVLKRFDHVVGALLFSDANEPTVMGSAPHEQA